VAGEPESVADRDKPLGRIPLVPFHSVPIVHRKLMVEIMVSLSQRHKRRKEVILRRVLIIECALAQPMSQRVDRERRL
jgi:hypothetical protein